MLKRPKVTDSEDDILEMQKAFIAEKAKNSTFQPAAQVVKVEKDKKQSLFAKNRQLKNDEGAKNCSEPFKNIVLGDIVEKSQECMMVDEPINFDIIRTGFPKAQRTNIRTDTQDKSLFALSMERKRAKMCKPPERKPEPKLDESETSFGESSAIVGDKSAAESIHKENVDMLQQMTTEEILAERAKLLQSMDKKLIDFLTNRGQRNSENISTSTQSTARTQQAPAQLMTIDEHDDSTSEIESVENILQIKDSENWVHFDVLEKEKIEWMKKVPSQIADLKPGEKFEARFDWKGVLLPYNDKETKVDDRELYLHGDEPNRPGYTLQELFRLARSNVIQQRVSAFSAIAGILNIYNQGFYDGVIELPITKIFFLLRFGFDENVPAILEVTSRGLATLFYNDTDETILDWTYETQSGHLQPTLEVDKTEMVALKETEKNIEKTFSNLQLTTCPFTAKVQDDENFQNSESMNDFQLAESDLVACLLRTNVIQRISYILDTVRPDNSTVISCFKILIRIARTNKDACTQIVLKDELLTTLINNFLTSFERLNFSNENVYYNMPQHLVLKLFRILISQHISFCIKLVSMKIVDILKVYIFSKQDINVNLIKVQIEAIRTLRAIICINSESSTYRDFLPAFRRMLEWHYQYAVYEVGGSPFIRQHAAALIAVILSGLTADAHELLGELISMCCCKWFNESSRTGIHEFSQSTLLALCLNCAESMCERNYRLFSDFISKYLRQFMISKAYSEFQEILCTSSILLKTITDRRNIYPALPNLGSVLVDDGSPSLIIPQKNPIYFLRSLFDLFQKLLRLNKVDVVNDMLRHFVTDELKNFLSNLSKRINGHLAINFLAKNEMKFIFKMICVNGVIELFPKETIMRIAYNMLSCMTNEHIKEIETLFSLIMFSSKFLNFEPAILERWSQIFLDNFVYPHQIVIAATDLSLSMPYCRMPILPYDWPYLLMKTVLNRYLNTTESKEIIDNLIFPEKEIITITLTFTELLERSGLEITSPTEKLMFLMIAFMGPDSEFLDKNLKPLLKTHIETFFEKHKTYKFSFEEVYKDKCKFENLYILFVDHFQAASYGDDLFSALVMVPLAQKYDSKWRKMIWSEQAAVLRFLNCSKDQLLGSIDDYLYPFEDDISLLRCYAQALNSNLLRPNSISYRLAVHHLEHFRNTKKHT